jgi:hypothetical protein
MRNEKETENKHNYYNNFNYYFCTDLFTTMRKKSDLWYHFLHQNLEKVNAGIVPL